MTPAPTQGTLAGRVCVLAGGSGGLGAACARRLHAEGAALVIGYRSNRERAEALVTELRASGAPPVATAAGDIADEDRKSVV